MERKPSLPLVLCLLTFAAMTVLFGNFKSGEAGNKKSYLNPPPEYIEHFHFGFAGSVADSLWLRWIQDGHDCQVYGGATVQETPKEVAVAAAAKMDGLAPRYKNCDNSWSFKMLDAVTKLDQKFEMAYFLGGLSLAVFVEDYAGATVLFDRGVKALPDDWKILYRAAYHYIFDLDDPKRGAELLVMAADKGAPIWVRSMAARLYSRAGQLDMGIATLENFKTAVKDETALKNIQKRIDEMKRMKAAAGKE